MKNLQEKTNKALAKVESSFTGRYLHLNVHFRAGLIQELRNRIEDERQAQAYELQGCADFLRAINKGEEKREIDPERIFSSLRTLREFVEVSLLFVHRLEGAGEVVNFINQLGDIRSSILTLLANHSDDLKAYIESHYDRGDVICSQRKEIEELMSGAHNQSIKIVFDDTSINYERLGENIAQVLEKLMYSQDS